MIHWKQLELAKGRTFDTTEKGNSMVPLIYSGQKHQLSPCDWRDCKVDDIVFCRISGHYYTHIVLAKDEHKGVQIGNNKGRVNGWTTNVYGKVTKIY